MLQIDENTLALDLYTRSNFIFEPQEFALYGLLLLIKIHFVGDKQKSIISIIFSSFQ